MNTVLVVDDDDAFREWLVAFLKRLLPGQQIVEAGDGNDGFRRALELRPHTVLLDVAMPGPNGLNVATAIAQALPHTRLLILSGAERIDESSLPEDIRYLRKDGALEDALRESLQL